MNAVEIESNGRTAWAQTGVTAGDYTRATGERGLATGLGDTASVGLGGITLAGGIGFLLRRNGLAIDDLLAAEVVTAHGELLEVDQETHADLFWALRGGGGNFGVATRLRLRLHEIDQVVGGMLMLPASTDVINGLVATADASPEELSVIANILKAPPLPFIPAEHHGKPVVIALMVYAGGAEAGEMAIAPIRRLATPLADMVRPIRYPEMFAVPEGPSPALDAGTNVLVDELPARAGETILEHLETATAAIAAVQLRVLGGAMARVPDEATAFGHRSAKLMVNIAAIHERPEERAGQSWASSLASRSRRQANVVVGSRHGGAETWRYRDPAKEATGEVLAPDLRTTRRMSSSSCLRTSSRRSMRSTSRSCSCPGWLAEPVQPVETATTVRVQDDETLPRMGRSSTRRSTSAATS